MLRTSSGLIMYSGSVSEEANCEGELNPDKASELELELVVEEVWAARDEEERDTSRQAVTTLLQSFFSGLHVAPDSIISVRLAILPRKKIFQYIDPCRSDLGTRSMSMPSLFVIRFGTHSRFWF